MLRKKQANDLAVDHASAWRFACRHAVPYRHRYGSKMSATRQSGRHTQARVMSTLCQSRPMLRSIHVNKTRLEIGHLIQMELTFVTERPYGRNL
jgi:hypothetical protein